MPPNYKRKTPESDAFDDDEARTPMGSPPRKRLRVTQQQKQALIDNLQLEITERARGLRAHYALQAQDLRARIERRINRIPMALRKKTMGELLAKYQETAKTEATMPSPFKKSTIPSRAAIPAQQIDKMYGRRLVSKTPRLPRRKTDDIHSSDKENAPHHDRTHPPLTNPKKRGKTNTTGGTGRVISQHAQGSVLSPKSSNSRTFPQSPLKQSPVKSQPYKSHPASPLKPSFGNYDENTKARSMRGTARGILSPQQSPANNRPESAASFRMKRSTVAKSATTTTTGTARKTISRPATRQQHTRAASTSTVASNASIGTTIVRSTRTGTTGTTKKTTTGTGTTKKLPTPRGQTGTAASNAKKTASTAGTRRGLGTTEAPSTGRRVLRNRA